VHLYSTLRTARHSLTTVFVCTLCRAVVHQVQKLAYSSGATVFGIGRVGTSKLTFVQMRELAANQMRSHREDFEPFLNGDGKDGQADSFETYCDKVASPIAAEWGGQLELQALSAALQRPIWVYDALQPTVTMGEGGSEPIRLSFHRHFYSLGEHYNSVVTKS
jgi:hypothetical protein